MLSNVIITIFHCVTLIKINIFYLQMYMISIVVLDSEGSHIVIPEVHVLNCGLSFAAVCVSWYS
jgi:hypothetical protein